MLRDVNLISYLPQFIQEYREIQNIMLAENPEIQILEDEMEIIKNNQFILSCNLVGIEKFEKLLSITPIINDTLEVRRSRVLIKWNNEVPYTYRVLLQKLDVLCGLGNYSLKSKCSLYELEVYVSLEHSKLRELDIMLRNMIPANITIIMVNKADAIKFNNSFTGTKVIRSKKVIVMNRRYE